MAKKFDIVGSGTFLQTKIDSVFELSKRCRIYDKLRNGSPNLRASKANVFLAICNSFISKRRKIVRVPQVIMTFMFTKSLS